MLGSSPIEAHDELETVYRILPRHAENLLIKDVPTLLEPISTTQ
jgi:hypothetical protein